MPSRPLLIAREAASQCLPECLLESDFRQGPTRQHRRPRGGMLRDRLRLLLGLFCALAGTARCLETLRARPGSTEEPTWVSHGCDAVRDFVQTTVFRNIDPWISRRRQWTQEEIRQIIENLGQPNWTLIPNYSEAWNGNSEFAQQASRPPSIKSMTLQRL